MFESSQKMSITHPHPHPHPSGKPPVETFLRRSSGDDVVARHRSAISFSGTSRRIFFARSLIRARIVASVRATEEGGVPDGGGIEHRGDNEISNKIVAEMLEIPWRTCKNVNRNVGCCAIWWDSNEFWAICSDSSWFSALVPPSSTSRDASETMLLPRPNCELLRCY